MGINNSNFGIEIRESGAWGFASFHGETIYVLLDGQMVDDLHSITSMIKRGHFKLTNETKLVMRILAKRPIYHSDEIDKYQYHLNKLRLLGLANFQVETDGAGNSCCTWHLTETQTIR